MATITYPLLTVTDDAGAIVSGATVTIASVTQPNGTAISSPGAAVVQAGPNVAVTYDAATKGEAWVTLAISKAGSTFTGLNASPAFYLSTDPASIAGVPAMAVDVAAIKAGESGLDILATVVSGTASSLVLAAVTGTLSTITNAYVGKLLIVKSTTNANLLTCNGTISAWNGGTSTATLSPALPAAPGAGDVVAII